MMSVEKRQLYFTVNILLTEKNELGANAQAIISMICSTTELETRQAEIKSELEVVVEMTERCVSENAQIDQNQEEYNERYNGLVKRYEFIKAGYDNVTQETADKSARKKQLEQFISTIKGQDPSEKFDEKLWSVLVDFITVYSEKDIRVTFKDGTEI